MKKIVILTAAAFMTVSGYAMADGANANASSSASVSDVSSQSAASGGTSMQGQLQGQMVVNGDYYEEGYEGNRGVERSENVQQIRYSGEYDLNNVPNVSAPGLTTTLTETCMGSTSVGGAVTGFGLSFGTTWRDSACVRRLDARELNSLGYRLGAKERMCDDDKNREALARAGTPCYVDLPAEQKREEDRAVVAPVAPAAETPALGSTADEFDAFAFQKLGS